MSIGLKGNTDGSGAIQVGGSDAITIDTSLVVSMNGGVQRPLISGTAVASTSGTSIDFTGIPSWAKRVTVMFNGVSTNGTSVVQVQIGDSGGVSATGYQSSTGTITGTNTCGLGGSTTGIGTVHALAASSRFGAIVVNLLTGNTWVAMGAISDLNNNNAMSTITSSKTLTNTLDRVRITTVNGTDTFDAGTINILYE